MNVVGSRSTMYKRGSSSISTKENQKYRGKDKGDKNFEMDSDRFYS